jgi:hypothetical protein
MGKDSRPEFVHYKDEGCELAPSCLECPFEKCILEEGGIASVLKKERNQEIKNLATQGITELELAERYGVSLRTIQRILSRK